MSVNSDQLLNTTGIQLPTDACIVIIRTEWNAAVLDKLEAGCCKVLEENSVCFKVLTVPGPLKSRLQ